MVCILPRMKRPSMVSFTPEFRGYSDCNAPAPAHNPRILLKIEFMLEVHQQPRQFLFTWPGWRLEFCWQADRWQHLLWQAEPAGWQRLLQSQEGTPDQPWPDSPAFQNAYVERINADCSEIQLLGQAGKNHYSGAVRCDAQKNLIDFDLAVRIHSEPAAPLLMSTYQLAPAFLNADPAKQWELHTEILSKQPPLLIDGGRAQDPSGTTMCLRMPDLSELRMEKQRATLRWKYQWRLAVSAVTADATAGESTR